jgi:hypothetical protein
MASNGGSQGSGNQGRGGTDQRGFASMDDAKQREIARKGGEASARKQGRDAQGQFTGSKSSSGGGSSSSGGSSSRSGGSGSRGGSGGSNR